MSKHQKNRISGRRKVRQWKGKECLEGWSRAGRDSGLEYAVRHGGLQHAEEQIERVLPMAQGRIAYQGKSLSLSADYLMGPIFLQGCRDCDMVVVEGVTAVRGEPIYDSV